MGECACTSDKEGFCGKSTSCIPSHHHGRREVIHRYAKKILLSLTLQRFEWTNQDCWWLLLIDYVPNSGMLLWLPSSSFPTALVTSSSLLTTSGLLPTLASQKMLIWTKDGRNASVTHTLMTGMKIVQLVTLTRAGEARRPLDNPVSKIWNRADREHPAHFFRQVVGTNLTVPHHRHSTNWIHCIFWHWGCFSLVQKRKECMWELT